MLTSERGRRLGRLGLIPSNSIPSILSSAAVSGSSLSTSAMNASACSRSREELDDALGLRADNAVEQHLLGGPEAPFDERPFIITRIERPGDDRVSLPAHVADLERRVRKDVRAQLVSRFRQSICQSTPKMGIDDVEPVHARPG
jgi:hypothetical protein